MPGEYLPPVITKLAGDIDDLVKKVEEAKALIKSLGKTTVEIGFDVNTASLTAAMAKAQAVAAKGITVPVRYDTSGASVGGALAGRAGFGALGWVMGLAGRGVNLFGGVLPGILGSVGAVHLLVDGVAEVLAVLIPATLAAVAFGVAASDAAKNIYNQFSAIHTVMDATGQTIPPMTRSMENLHQAVQPQVYSMLGDALTVINNKAGEFSQVAKGAADVFSYFAARATVALTSSGFSNFLKNAVGDLRGIFNVFGNIAGTIGAILKNLPGYAETILNVLQTVTHAVEVFANSGVGQGVIKFGLAFHGAFIYIGLLATLAARALPMIVGWVSKLAYGLAGLAEGAGLDAASAALYRFGGAAEAAAASGPWGWVALAGAAIGVLAYKITTATTSTQNYVAAVQQGLGNKSAGIGGFTALSQAQADIIGKMPAVNGQATQAQQAYNSALAKGGPAVKQLGDYARQTDSNVTALRGGQTQLSDQTKLYEYRLNALADKYGGVGQAQRLLTLAGVKMGAMLDKSSQAWKIIQQQVSGVVQGYAAMSQRGGTLGADLYAITSQATDQYKAMQTLNQAWSTFMGNMSGLQSSSVTAIQSLREMQSEAKKTGASFTGVNANSLTLQGTWANTFEPQLQSVIGSMRQGHASTTDLATVISTLLNPAVKDGALKNQQMRQQIYDMARQAGYTGPNAIRPLTNFVNTMKTTFQNAMNIINRTGAALGHLPKTENLHVFVTGAGSWQQNIQGANGRRVIGPNGPGLAAGGRLAGYGGGDRHPAMLESGETVVSKEASRLGFMQHAFKLARVPGYASGGIIGSYSGAMSGLGPWATHDYWATVQSMGSQARTSFMGMLGGGGGASSAGGTYNRAMLERLWIAAGGPPGMALLMSAIALAESSGNPLAHNSSGATGLWQILGSIIPGNLYNPMVNAENAVAKYRSQGLGAWTTYTGGQYRAFMDQGGYLMPGNTLVTNGTGRPERVLNPDQEAALMGGEQVTEVNIYLDSRLISKTVQKNARQYNRRNGPPGSNKWAGAA